MSPNQYHRIYYHFPSFYVMPLPSPVVRILGSLILNVFIHVLHPRMERSGFRINTLGHCRNKVTNWSSKSL